MDAPNSEMGVCSNLKTGELKFTGFSIALILIIIVIIIIIIIIIIINWKYTLTAMRTSANFCFLPLTQCEFFYSFFFEIFKLAAILVLHSSLFSLRSPSETKEFWRQKKKPIISWWCKLRNKWTSEEGQRVWSSRNISYNSKTERTVTV